MEKIVVFTMVMLFSFRLGPQIRFTGLGKDDRKVSGVERSGQRQTVETA
jgi:hypothetical protein